MTLALAFWLVVVIVFDLRQRRVPNWLVLAGLPFAVLTLSPAASGAGWLAMLAAGAISFGVMLVFYALGLMGAGDVKFAGVLGFWVGLPALLPIWIISSLLAAVHSLLWLGLQRWPVSHRLVALLSDPRELRTATGREAMSPPAEVPTTAPATRSRHVPYAAYLAMAALIWLCFNASG